MLLALAGGTCAAEPAAAGVAPSGLALSARVAGGFPTADRDRWTFVRFDLRGGADGPTAATLAVERESGRVERWREPLPPMAARAVLRYAYEGGPDPVVAATAEVGGTTTQWRRPDRIPPARLVVVATADDARALPVSSLLSATRGIGVDRARTDSLPDRWMAWRGVAAVVAWADEVPAAASAEGRALSDYVAAGGIVMLYPGGDEDEGGVFASLPPGDATLGRGQVLRMGAGGHLRPPELPDAAIRPPPAEARVLVATPPAPPTAWLEARAAWFAPLALLGLMALRLRPVRGALAVALAVGGAALAPPPPSAAPASVREATWASGDGYARSEVAAVPGRTGPLRIPAPADASVVALDPGTALDLSLDDAGAFWVPARWGSPVRVLVEAIARDH